MAIPPILNGTPGDASESGAPSYNAIWNGSQWVPLGSTNALPVSQPGLSGGLDHGVVTLTTANVAVAIVPDPACVRLTIRNVSPNAAIVFGGMAGVTADYAAGTGAPPLAPDPDTARRCGESRTYPINATAPIYVVSATALAVVAWDAVLA